MSQSQLYVSLGIVGWDKFQTVRRRSVGDKFARRTKVYRKIPRERLPVEMDLASKSPCKDTLRNVVHVSRTVLDRQTKLIESVQTDLHLLNIRNLNANFLVWLDISNLNRHQILTFRVDLTISCLLTLFYGLGVLLFRFFFLFDPTLHPLLCEGCCELMKADIGSDGKTVSNF